MTKKLFLLVLAFSMSVLTFSQDRNYRLSSHILDINTGKPAQGVRISLAKKDKNNGWITIDEKITDQNGRVKDFLEEGGKDNTGIYKLTFHTGPYFKAMEQDSFYPFIEVVFEIKDGNHYHVPLTLSPYGYSTYRGN